ALVSADSALQQADASASSDYTQLAEALENNPLRIYQFIRNHFEYVPYYGALKGPYLTLLERSGNDFDQAALLVELLRAAGYTTHYQYGTMTMPLSAANGLDLAHWLGTEADNTIIGNLIASGGIPATNNSSSFTLDRVWVVVDINGTPYQLDPAFKPSSISSGIDLSTAMGYNQAALLSAAGGTTGTDSISNLNQSALDNQLDSLTTNLVAHLKQNHFNAQVSDIVGGRTITADNSGVLPVALPFAGTATELPWTEIPSTYMHTVQFEHGGINITKNIAEIAGKKVSISYVRDTTVIEPAPSGVTDFGTINEGGEQVITWSGISNPNPFTIQLNITLSGSNAFSFVSGGGSRNLAPDASHQTSVKFLAAGQSAGRKNATLTFTWSYNSSVYHTDTVTLTGVIETTPVAQIYLDDLLLIDEGTPGGNLSDFFVSVDHPYAENSGTFADQPDVKFTLNRSNGSYVLASAFGGDRHSQLLSERQRLLNNMTLQGMASDSREVLSETLNVIGQTWMQQTQLNAELIGALSDHRVLRHHRFGIVGQEAGYFIDVKAQSGSLLPETSSASSSGFQASSFVASAMEHSVLEQLQGMSNPGISTIK
ncbi:MAG: transglutaminase-like domain-containing protein, partial [gamma proteobacterium symbiont of Bathyaustriella thionipta]|nr:transglutaminase-like domain-containing protein [gamma proteobacterium symbiont of Bathyaustriella thionipta]